MYMSLQNDDSKISSPVGVTQLRRLFKFVTLKVTLLATTSRASQKVYLAKPFLPTLVR
jgi:hypothetical protein